MASLSTHILDTATGRPAAGVAVRLQDATGDDIAAAVTDSDGRVQPLGPELVPGGYRLVFGTGDYFAAAGRQCFHPQVVIDFTVVDSGEHYHVPLLLSPYGYTTYRGS